MPSRKKDCVSKQCFLSREMDTLNKAVAAFWQIEEINDVTTSDELKICNENFNKTHYRKPNGRYVVNLPFKSEIMEDITLGDSKCMANKRLNLLWLKLERNVELKDLYKQFLREYEQLGHMEEIVDEADTSEGYFLAHHGVLKPSSSTTKLGVVFDGSAKTTNGKSLKDILLKGGTIQEELFHIILRFRKHVYALTTDIKMMFRQIEVEPSQTRFQKILWKENKDSPVKTYALKTVSYGTAPASYLATKTLQQLAIDEKDKFPLASEVVLNDFYMDDCLSGSSNLEEFNEFRNQLKSLLLVGV
nr:uncharacterized protein LOC107441131 [Parasteatoda tepidariorum]